MTAEPPSQGIVHLTDSVSRRPLGRDSRAVQSPLTQDRNDDDRQFRILRHCGVMTFCAAILLRQHGLRKCIIAEQRAASILARQGANP